MLDITLLRKDLAGAVARLRLADLAEMLEHALRAQSADLGGLAQTRAQQARG